MAVCDIAAEPPNLALENVRPMGGSVGVEQTPYPNFAILFQFNMIFVRK